MGMEFCSAGGAPIVSGLTIQLNYSIIMSKLWRQDLSGGPDILNLRMPHQSTILYTDSPPDEVGMTQGLIAMSEDCM